MFWRPSTTLANDTTSIVSSVHDLCKVAGGGIGIEAYVKNNKDENAKVDQHEKKIKLVLTIIIKT
jgi:hypothetical protein